MAVAGPVSMRAARHAEPGSAAGLDVVEVPRPEPGPDEVLIQVNLAGVNFSDVVGQRLGVNRFTGRPTTPGEIPGGEVVGVRSDTGERVVALCETGGYAEWATAPERLTFPIPDGVPDDAALALFVSGVTAWLLYRPFARLEGGETVVVQAAAGGVGSIAVQLGRLMGAGRVIGVASTPRKRALAAELGADVAIDGRVEGLRSRLQDANGGEPADVIFEMTGGRSFEECWAALAPFGRLVVFGTASGDSPPVDTRSLIPGSRTVSGVWLIDAMRSGRARDALEQLFEHQRQGRVRAVFGPVFPLSEAVQAQAELVGRRTHGKVLLDPTAAAAR